MKKGGLMKKTTSIILAALLTVGSVYCMDTIGMSKQVVEVAGEENELPGETAKEVDAQGYTKVLGSSSGTQENLGAWNYRVFDYGNIGGMDISYKNGEEPSGFSVRIDRNTTDNKPGAAYCDVAFPIEKEEQYTYKIKINVKSRNNIVVRMRILGFTSMTDIELKPGVNELSGKIKAIGSSTTCKMEFNLGFIKENGTILDFEEVALEKEEKKDLLPLILSTKNVAKDKNAYSANGFTAILATDGKINTKWMSSTESEWESMTIDLGAKCQIASIENMLLKWNDMQTYSKEYNVEVSEDNENYYKVFSVNDDAWNLIVGRSDKNNILDLPLDFSKVPVSEIQYVRLNGKVLNGRIEVAEFAVIVEGELIIPTTEEATTVKEIQSTKVQSTEKQSVERQTSINQTMENETKSKQQDNEYETTTAPTETKAIKKLGKTKIKKINIRKRRALLVIKAIKNADGYMIKYSPVGKAKKTKVKVTNKKKIVIKKLKSGKKYYFKVRAYSDVNGKKVYGPWSKVKKTKRIK